MLTHGAGSGATAPDDDDDDDGGDPTSTTTAVAPPFLLPPLLLLLLLLLLLPQPFSALEDMASRRSSTVDFSRPRDGTKMVAPPPSASLCRFTTLTTSRRPSECVYTACSSRFCSCGASTAAAEPLTPPSRGDAESGTDTALDDEDGEDDDGFFGGFRTTVLVVVV